jgi:hypothetical protein
MALQKWGYTEWTPKALFEHIHEKKHDRKKELENRTKAPSFSHFAAVVEELTPLKANVLTNKSYEEYRQRSKTLSPHDILRMFLIHRDAPCVIRTLGHCLLITGVDLATEEYTYIDPLLGKELTRKMIEIDKRWGEAELNYPEDARYLMLAMYPKNKSNT